MNRKMIVVGLFATALITGLSVFVSAELADPSKHPTMDSKSYDKGDGHSWKKGCGEKWDGLTDEQRTELYQKMAELKEQGASYEELKAAKHDLLKEYGIDVKEHSWYKKS